MVATVVTFNGDGVQPSHIVACVALYQHGLRWVAIHVKREYAKALLGAVALDVQGGRSAEDGTMTPEELHTMRYTAYEINRLRASLSLCLAERDHAWSEITRVTEECARWRALWASVVQADCILRHERCDRPDCAEARAILEGQVGHAGSNP